MMEFMIYLYYRVILFNNNLTFQTIKNHPL